MTRNRVWLLSMLLLTLLCCSCASANETLGNQCGENVTWEIQDGHVLVISGTGPMADYAWHDTPWTSFADSIVDVEITEGVTRIGNHAFSCCNEISHITVPASVTQFGTNVVPESVRFGGSMFYFSIIPDSAAESYCIQNGMEYVYPSLPLYTYETLADGTISITKYNGHRQDDQYVYRIPSVVDGHAVKVIGDYAFTGLLRKIVEVPEGITSIGAYAFRDCTSISMIKFPQSLTSIGAYAFDGCTNMVYSLSYKSAQEICEISGNLSSIGEGAFQGCDSLLSVSIMSGLTSIPPNAFADCSNLGTVRIMDSVTEIAGTAFDNCPIINVFTTPGSAADEFFTDADIMKTYTLTSGDYLYEATGDGAYLTGYIGTDKRITVPAAIDDLPVKAIAGFAGNTLLETVVISEGIQRIDRNAFADCSNLTFVSIPESVTEIFDCAFCNCTSLETIHLPSGLTGMRRLFEGCTSLTDVNIPSGVRAIESTFFGCTSLQDIRIPSGVTILSSMAFYQCTNLRSISLPDTLIEIGDLAFDWCQNLSLYIPSSVTTIGTDAFRNGMTKRIYCHDGSAAHAFAVQNDIPFELVTASGDCSEWGNPTAAHWVVKDGTTLIIYGSGAIPDWNKVIADESLAASITAIVIEPGITRIGGNPFEGLGNVTSLQIPDTVTSIGGYIFGGLGEFVPTIPASVTDIDLKAFAWCKIPNLNIASDNPAYTCVDGVLYNKDMTALYACLGGKQTPLVIPATITTFTPEALESATGVEEIVVSEQNTSFSAKKTLLLSKDGTTVYGAICWVVNVEIPSGVTTIAERAFLNCFNLTTLAIPESVTAIQDKAFKDDKNLNRVFYAGTDADWSNISFGANNEWLTGANIRTEYLNYLCGNHLIWTRDGDTLTISPTTEWSEMYSYQEAYYSNQDSPWGNDIKHVILEEGVMTIGDYAFTGHSQLESISIPRYLYSIGTDALSYCSNLSNVKVSPDNDVFKTVDGVLVCNWGPELVLYPSSLSGSEYTVPNGVVSIRDTAFHSCANLTSVTVPEGVLYIGSLNFAWCPQLTVVNLPASLTGLGDNVFGRSENLQSIHVAEGNESFASIDGILFDCAGTTLLAFPNGRSGVYTLPENVTAIGDHAFFYNTKLTGIEFSQNLESIGSFAFQFCSALTDVRLPGSLTAIGDYAFSRCDNLTEILIPASVTDIGTNAFWRSENNVICCEPESTALQYAIESQIAHVYGGACGDNLTWRLEDGVLAIAGTGPMYDYGWRCASDGTTWYPKTPWINENREAIEPLSAVVLSEGITVIGENAFNFYGPSYYATPPIPSTVTRLAQDAINGFYYDEFYVPSALTSIDPGCRIDAARFTVDSENPVYSAAGGVLYSKDQHVVIRYPLHGENSVFEAPSSVTSFEATAFAPGHPESMIIPASAQQISLNNVVDCVQSITILGMDTVLDSSIDDVTFERTTPLTLRFFPYSSAQAYASLLTDKTDVIREYIPFSNTLALPENTNVIENEAFADLGILLNIQVPADVSEIADDAFACSKVLLFVVSGTEGEAFAIRNNIPFVIQ